MKWPSLQRESTVHIPYNIFLISTKHNYHYLHTKAENKAGSHKVIIITSIFYYSTLGFAFFFLRFFFFFSDLVVFCTAFCSVFAFFFLHARGFGPLAFLFRCITTLLGSPSTSFFISFNTFS